MIPQEEVGTTPNEFFRIAFCTSPVGMSLTSPNGQFLQTNVALQQMTGYSGGELSRMGLIDLIHPEDLPETFHLMTQMADQKRERFHVDRRYRRKDGRIIWTQSTINIIYGADSRISYLTITDEEHSERRRAEQALQAIAEATFSPGGPDFFHSLVRNLAVALDVPYAFVTECLNSAMTRAKALAFWMNDDFFEGYEYDLAGTPCERVIHDDKMRYYPAGVQALFPTDLDLVKLKAQGYLGIPIYDSLGRVLGHLVVMDHKVMESEPRGLSILKIFAARAGAELERKRRDMEREKLIGELQEASMKALEASRLKSEFLATMSHELRTPLNAIIGFSGIMLEGMAGTMDDTSRSMIQAISDSSKNLLTIINDILDLSKIEAGRLELVEAPITIRQLVSEWRSQVEILARAKGLAFEIDIDPALPDRLIGDQERISQLVSNLLSNAVKFTEKGSIHLYVKWGDKLAIFEVRDTGIGIPPHALSYIFDEFRQVDGSYRRQYGGTGLGLAIVRKLARVMGGQIHVNSQLGKGSVFTLTLPLRVEEDNEVSNVA